MGELIDFPTPEEAEPTYICVQCGDAYVGSGGRQALEQHWDELKHSPDDVQRQRLLASRTGQGLLADPEGTDGPEAGD